MGSWTKFYADGSKYTADDAAVRAGFASWRKSRLNQMVGVSLTYGDQQLLMLGYGDYWQSDQYEVSFPAGRSELVCRRIMKQISAQDKAFRYHYTSYMATVAFNQPLTEGKALTIASDWHGKWLVLEYSLKTGTAHHYLSKTNF